jgi:hypothetical protein
MRNEKCPCGSDKKYKKCCGRPKKQLTQNGMLKILQYLARNCEGGMFKIACNMLESVPDEEALGISYNVDDDSFEIISQVPPPKPLIEIARCLPPRN